MKVAEKSTRRQEGFAKMDPIMWAAVIALFVFVGTLASLEAGFRWGGHAVARDPTPPHEGVGGIEASAFALLGLLLGFSFAGATSRLEQKRGLIVEEANAQTYLPPLIVGLIVGAAILSGLLAGYAMAKRQKRSWFHASHRPSRCDDEDPLTARRPCGPARVAG